MNRKAIVILNLVNMIRIFPNLIIIDYIMMGFILSFY